MSAMPRWAVLAVVAAVVAAIVGLGVYASSQRAAADTLLATDTVEGLSALATRGSQFEKGAQYDQFVGDIGYLIALYERSATAARHPELTEHIRRSWLANQVAAQLWVRADEGAVSVPVSDVGNGAAGVEAFPALAATVTSDAPAAFDLGGRAALKVALDEAAKEVKLAEEELGRKSGGR